MRIDGINPHLCLPEVSNEFVTQLLRKKKKNIEILYLLHFKD